MKCRDCRHNRLIYGDGKHLRFCAIAMDSKDEDAERECKEFERRTEADRIRNMTDDELAAFLIDVSDGLTQISVCDEECETCANDLEACVEMCRIGLCKEVNEE